MSSRLDSYNGDIHAVVIGASGGIGKALIKHLYKNEKVKRLYALSRSEIEFEHNKIHHASIDITDEESIENAAAFCEGDINFIIVATGMLSDGDHLPEKSMRDLNLESMQKCFGINVFGPALIAKHFLPRLPKTGRSVFACLSARVGSISNNQIGGWYSYRASKAALNMMLKTAAIETGRRYKDALILGLHPGTVDTQLSKPFQNNVAHEIFTPARAADHLLDVIDKKGPEDSGKCFAWDGQEILP